MTTMSPPVSPQAQYEGSSRVQPRPRAVSSMSQASTSSRRSRTSNKLDLTESAKDKKRLVTKADPSMAMTEAQPSDVALEHSNLDDIRKMQHRDGEGNFITDPDRSNPTRYRMERPLDTIRAFNAAAEGTSRSRTSSYGRPMSQYGSEVGGNRRGSSYGNQPYTQSPQRPRYGNGYYRNSNYGMPQGSLDEISTEHQYQSHTQRMRNPNNVPNHYQNGHANGGYYNQPADSPMSAHSQQQSYETMTSGSDENGKSTNPSSLNSSFDHLHQMQLRKQENPGYQNGYENQYSNDINFAPVSSQHQQLHKTHGAVNGYAHQQNGNVQVRDYDPDGGSLPGNGYGGPPRPPAKDMNGVGNYAQGNNPRVPIKLNGAPSEEPFTQDKRKSWIKRTFSRRN